MLHEFERLCRCVLLTKTHADIQNLHVRAPSPVGRPSSPSRFAAPGAKPAIGTKPSAIGAKPSLAGKPAAPASSAVGVDKKTAEPVKLQYNSPVGLYSPQNADEALQDLAKASVEISAPG